MIYLLVDADRILEGTLQNAVSQAITVRSIKAADIQTHLFPIGYEVEETNPDPSQNLTNKALANSQRKTHTKKIRPPVYVPNLIIYRLGADSKKNEENIKLLRKACFFRDVPILVAADVTHSEQAKRQIQWGATDWLLFPQPPEKLVSLIEQVMQPVGTNIPVVTYLINPFISATVDLMSTMAGLHVQRKQLFLKRNYRLFGDISGIMNLAGKVEGTVVVSFGEELARDIVAKIMGCHPGALSNDEVREGVGELVNIISGNARAALANTEYGHQITLPTVITGCSHEISHPPNAPCIVVIFEAESRPFAVLVCTAPTHK